MLSATRSNRQGRTGQWLSTVAAAVIAVVGSVAPTSQAQASIVYSGATNIAVPVSTAGIYLNVVTGLSGITPGAVPGWDINIWGTSTAFFWANNAASPNSGIVDGLGNSTALSDNLSVGTTVDGSQVYGRIDSPETTGATAFLINSSNNYIGFRILNEITGQYDFGWLQMQFGPALNNANRFILGWAYENTGAAIRVGDTGSVVAVPEPGTLALLAAALTAGAVRTRRSAAA